MTLFANLVIYQLGWFACVLGAAYGIQWIGVALSLGLFALHLTLATDFQVQCKLAAAAVLMGLTVDSLQIGLGVFTFPNSSIVAWLPPPFMPALWLLFATTLRYCMSWMQQRYLLSTLLGLLGGPIAFFAGERLGAISIESPRLLSFVVLGAVWAVCVPTLVYLSDRLAAAAEIEARYRWPWTSINGERKEADEFIPDSSGE